MRALLAKLLPRPMLPQVCPYDEFFLAGPPAPVLRRNVAEAPVLVSRRRSSR